MRAPQNVVTRVAQRLLRRAGTDLAVATSARITAARDARELGLSHQQIADELGITEAAVRGLLRRNPERVL